ncbi:MAG: hypothetical protein AAGG75_18850 [Bacteroidota bacterium]
MKTLLPFVLAFFSFFLLQAQEEDTPRLTKGSFMIETGYNVVGGISSGSGFNLISGEGTTILSFGGDFGYFVADNFALKFRLSLLGLFDDFDDESLTIISVGGKYYLAGQVPLEASIGVISGFGATELLGNILVGYAIPLAKNINLEPSVGLILSDGDSLFNAKIPFVLFF